MNIVTIIAGILLGLLFIMGGATFLLHLVAMPTPPEGSAMAAFMTAFVPTGYMTFVKIFELVGGLLVMIPKTRRAGLFLLGPIIVNILAYHGFVMGGEGLTEPPLIVLVVLSLYLLWVERLAFWTLIRPGK